MYPHTITDRYIRTGRGSGKQIMYCINLLILTELNPSAITDHVAKKHTIELEGVKFPARDTDWTARGVKEVV